MKIYLFDNQHKIYTRKNPAKKQPCFSGENTKHANNQSISNIVNGYCIESKDDIPNCNTFDEINYAVGKTIISLKEKGEKLPYLLEYYDNNYEVKVDDSILSYYNNNNNLPEEYSKILKERLGL